MEAAALARDFAGAAKIGEDLSNIDRQTHEDVGWWTSSAHHLVCALAASTADHITLTLGPGLEELYAKTLEGLYEIK